MTLSLSGPIVRRRVASSWSSSPASGGERPGAFGVAVQLVLDGVADGAVALDRGCGRARARRRRPAPPPSPRRAAGVGACRAAPRRRRARRGGRTPGRRYASASWCLTAWNEPTGAPNCCALPDVGDGQVQHPPAQPDQLGGGGRGRPGRRQPDQRRVAGELARRRTRPRRGWRPPSTADVLAPPMPATPAVRRCRTQDRRRPPNGVEPAAARRPRPAGPRDRPTRRRARRAAAPRRTRSRPPAARRRRSPTSSRTGTRSVSSRPSRRVIRHRAPKTPDPRPARTSRPGRRAGAPHRVAQRDLVRGQREPHGRLRHARAGRARARRRCCAGSRSCRRRSARRARTGSPCSTAWSSAASPPSSSSAISCRRDVQLGPEQLVQARPGDRAHARRRMPVTWCRVNSGTPARRSTRRRPAPAARGARSPCARRARRAAARWRGTGPASAASARARSRWWPWRPASPGSTLAEHVGVGHEHVVEEDLGEALVAVEPAEAAHGHAGGVAAATRK